MSSRPLPRRRPTPARFLRGKRPTDKPRAVARDEASRATASMTRGVRDAPARGPAGGAYRSALVAGFPKLAIALAGDFDAVVAGYVARHPGLRLSVREAGAKLAAHLATGHPRWWSEIAAIDRAYVEMMDDRDVALMTREDLGHADLASLELALVPHRFVRLTTAADEVWAAIDRREPFDAPHELARPRTVVVWRSVGEVTHRTLDADEARALRSLTRTAPFSDVSAAFARQANPSACALDAVLRWIDHGLLAAPPR